MLYTHRENRHNVCTVYNVYGINYELKMHENHRRAFIGNIQQTENSGAIQNIKRLYNQNLIDTVQMNNVYGESESLVLLISTFSAQSFFATANVFDMFSKIAINALSGLWSFTVSIFIKCKMHCEKRKGKNDGMGKNRTNKRSQWIKASKGYDFYTLTARLSRSAPHRTYIRSGI